MDGFAIYKTPVGFLNMEYEDDTIVRIIKVDKYVNSGKKTQLTEEVYLQLMEYFSGERRNFNFPYKLRGTRFQKEVWEEVLKIPYGAIKTYKEVAINLGDFKKSRAVGMANSKNPMIIVVPCHRVVGINGDLVGYSGGLEMKDALIKLEKRLIDK